MAVFMHLASGLFSKVQCQTRQGYVNLAGLLYDLIKHVCLFLHTASVKITEQITDCFLAQASSEKYNFSKMYFHDASPHLI